MKYPQLVSPRAVNAISDWLISRLEQLGVEAPQIYARFLLSLLQSSVQINDPIEYSSLETFITSRKGNGKRLHQLPEDTATLRKLTAVQCLQGIVSADQEITTIEILVDELCAKLKDFEQNSDIRDDAGEVTAALLLNTETKNQQQKPQEKSLEKVVAIRVVAPHQNKQRGKESCEKVLKLKIPSIVVFGKNSNNQNNSGNFAERRNSSVLVETFKQQQQEQQDIETDPKKRYFRAFPALSKDMDEDSFRALRQHAKSLTWPVDRLANNNIINNTTKTTTNNINNNNNKNNSSIKISSNDSTSSSNSQILAEEQRSKVNSSGNETVVVAKNTGTVKRRSRRRRNQAALKNKSLQQKSGEQTNSNAAATGGETNQIQPSTGRRGKRKERYSTPTYWDTDFEGCWEMGRDLIKEFIDKQNNRNNRNRSTSESAAYQVRNMQDSEDKFIPIPNNDPFDDVDDDADEDEHAEFFDLSEEDDPLATVSELAMNVAAAMPLGGPRRLYERDICLEKPKATLKAPAPELTAEETEADFEQFKAKFNSSVEALWKDEQQASQKTAIPNTQTSEQRPQQQDDQVSRAKLKSFWSHYFHEQAGDGENINLNLAQAKEPENNATAAAGFMSLNNITVAPLRTTELAANTETANTSDYYSMPSNWGDYERNSSSRKVGMASNMVSSTESTTPVGVFLQDSIWSGNNKATTATADTDESFYFKVWNANKQLNDQLEGNQGDNKNAVETVVKTTNSAFNKKGNTMKSSADGGFAPFAVSKWSEGINAGPPTAPNALGFDAIDSSTTGSASTTSCSSSMYPWPHHWQTPGVIGQFTQNTVMSLTEMYGNDVVDAMGGSSNSSATSSLNSPAMEHGLVDNGPKVTLQNHAFGGSSAFMEFSRIKTYGKRLPPAAAQEPRKAISTMDATIRRDSNENLLTSDSTHFQPIRTYRDGHTFNICSSWDKVNYERSASGFLYLGTDKYLEYKRNDNYTVEDDAAAVAIAGVVNTMPLYASSNCDAANNMRKQQQQQQQHRQLNVSAKKKLYQDELVLKFRIKNNCEIACQTEDPREVAAAAAAEASAKDRLNALKLTEQHPMSLLFAGGARYGMRATTRPLSNATGTTAHSDALYALNKAIASAAKSRAVRRMQNPMTSYAFNNNIIMNNNDSNNNNKNNNIHKNYNNNQNNFVDVKNKNDEIAWMIASTTKNAMQHTAQQSNKSNMYQSFVWPINPANQLNMKCNQNNMSNNNDEVDYCLSKNNYNDVDDDVDDDDNDYDNVGERVKSPWSMSAIGKKCQLNEHKKRKRLNNSNNNKSCNKNQNNYDEEHNIKSNKNDNDKNDEDEDETDDDEGHTLWGMCAACHSENKSLSLPANSLLRDELNQEADEIMSELKNMQNLYIGRNNDTDTDEDDENHDYANSIDMEADNDAVTVSASEVDWRGFKPNHQQQPQTNHQSENQEQKKPNKVLQQMNRFIEDWLRPSTFQGEKYDIWNINKPKGANIVKTSNSQDKKKFPEDNIWFTDNEQNINNNTKNIWQSKDQNAYKVNEENSPIPMVESTDNDTLTAVVAFDNDNGNAWKPLDILRQLSVAESKTQQSKDDTFLSKLHWEHENLAAIWKTATPTPKMLAVEDIEKTLLMSESPQEKQEEESQKSEGKKQIVEKNVQIEQKGNHLRSFLQDFDNYEKHAETLKYASVPTTTPKIGSNRKRRHSESLNYLESMQNKTHDKNDFIFDIKSNMEFDKNNSSGGKNKSTCATKLFTDNGFYDTIDSNMANEYDINDNDNDINDNDPLIDYDDYEDDGGGGDYDESRDIQQQQQQQQLDFDNKAQTIITCKYWATPADSIISCEQRLLNSKGNPLGEINNDDDDEIDAETAAAAAIDSNNQTFSCLFDKNASILRHVTTAMVARPLTR